MQQTVVRNCDCRLWVFSGFYHFYFPFVIQATQYYNTHFLIISPIILTPDMASGTEEVLSKYLLNFDISLFLFTYKGNVFYSRRFSFIFL